MPNIVLHKRLKRLYNLNIAPLGLPPVLLSHGDLKTLCIEAAALLPTMPNYAKVRRELNRIGSAYASMQLDATGHVVLVTIIWDSITQPTDPKH
jgi:hypothetical protein